MGSTRVRVRILRAYVLGGDNCERSVPLDHPIRAGERFIVRSEERFQARACSNCSALETMDEFT